MTCFGKRGSTIGCGDADLGRSSSEKDAVFMWQYGLRAGRARIQERSWKR